MLSKDLRCYNTVSILPSCYSNGYVTPGIMSITAAYLAKDVSQCDIAAEAYWVISEMALTCNRGSSSSKTS
jgi:hypothetical protein